MFRFWIREIMGWLLVLVGVYILLVALALLMSPPPPQGVSQPGILETPGEVEQFFDATARTNIGICLDTGHCYYGGGDPIREADKYKSLLRYIHIKDIDRMILDECKRKEMDFNQAVEAGVFTQIGRGCLDFSAFFRCAARNGYSGWCVVEQDIKFGVSPVRPKESMGASLKYLRNILGQVPIK